VTVPTRRDRAVDGNDLADARHLGQRDEIGLGEVEALQLVDLERAEQEVGVDGLHGRQRDCGAHQLGDPGRRHKPCRDYVALANRPAKR